MQLRNCGCLGKLQLRGTFIGSGLVLGDYKGLRKQGNSELNAFITYLGVRRL